MVRAAPESLTGSEVFVFIATMLSQHVCCLLARFQDRSRSFPPRAVIGPAFHAGWAKP
jgi:hypothetical protein